MYEAGIMHNVETAGRLWKKAKAVGESLAVKDKNCAIMAARVHNGRMSIGC